MNVHIPVMYAYIRIEVYYIVLDGNLKIRVGDYRRALAVRQLRDNIRRYMEWLSGSSQTKSVRTFEATILGNNILFFDLFTMRYLM